MRINARHVGTAVALLVTLGVGGTAEASTTSSTQPPTTTAPQPPSRLDAAVTLGCGSTESARVVLSFQSSAAPGQTAVLSFQTPQSGGFLLTQVGIGDEVPVPPNLVWSIVGIQLGPWPVNSITDECSTASGTNRTLAETGAGPRMELVVLASLLVVAGALLARSVSRVTRRQYPA